MLNNRRGIIGICLALMILFLFSQSYSEIIKVSMIKKKQSKFSVKRDIFSPIPMVPQQGRRPVAQSQLPKPDIKKVKPNLENEVRQSLFYEGYISKGEKSHALLNVSGEYFVVAEGDTVLGRIKVIKVHKKAIVIEVESQSFEIVRKGENGEE